MRRDVLPLPVALPCREMYCPLHLHPHAGAFTAASNHIPMQGDPGMYCPLQLLPCAERCIAPISCSPVQRCIVHISCISTGRCTAAFRHAPMQLEMSCPLQSVLLAIVCPWLPPCPQDSVVSAASGALLLLHTLDLLTLGCLAGTQVRGAGRSGAASRGAGAAGARRGCKKAAAASGQVAAVLPGETGWREGGYGGC